MNLKIYLNIKFMHISVWGN